MSSRITVSGPRVEGTEEILTPAALDFLADLHVRFAARRDELLAARQCAGTRSPSASRWISCRRRRTIRSGDWTVAPIPDYLADRRVEITGPTDRKMTINALNSGAKVWLADLEDANTPAWSNVISGQINLRDAIRRTVELDQDGKSYRLKPTANSRSSSRGPAAGTSPEKHLTIDGAAAGRRARRLRAVLLPQRGGAAGPRCRARLLPAEDGVAIWRRGSGRRCSRSPRRRWACGTAPSGPRC